MKEVNDERNSNFVSKSDTENVENVMYKCTSEPIAIHPLPSSKRVEAPATHSQLTNSSHPQQNKICYDSCHSAQGGPVFIINQNTIIMRSFNEAVASLRKAGAKEYKDVRVMNVTVTEKDSWTRIALTLDQEVDGFVSDDNGDYTKGTTRIVFLSLYSIAAVLKNNDDTLAIGSYVVNHPTALQILLSGAKIDILQQEVAANATYLNHFTGEEVEHQSDHDSIFTRIVAIALSDKGLRAVEKIEDKLLGL